MSALGSHHAGRDNWIRRNTLKTDAFPTTVLVIKELRGFPAALPTTGSYPIMLVGSLTIHGVTKQVVLNLEGPTPTIKDPWGNSRVGGTATTKINRKDFGLTWNAALKTGAVVVVDDVAIPTDVAIYCKPPGR